MRVSIEAILLEKCLRRIETIAKASVIPTEIKVKHILSEINSLPTREEIECIGEKCSKASSALASLSEHIEDDEKLDRERILECLKIISVLF